jgi:hypothetical protein
MIGDNELGRKHKEAIVIEILSRHASEGIEENVKEIGQDS